MNVQNSIAEFLESKKIAVVGASNDPAKYGNIIFRKLRKQGYIVFPVNPDTAWVAGEICYPSVQDLPEKVDGAVIVIPPAFTEEVVKDALQMGINNIWIQPGADSPEAVKLCENQKKLCIYRKCILTELSKLNERETNLRVW